MKQYNTVSIKQPCDQNWEEMQPAATGKFCGACRKNVVDFTAFSDEQFIAYFQNHPRPSDLCGKLSERQLSLKISPKPVRITFRNVNKVAAASLIAALGFSCKADARVKDTLYAQSIFESKPDRIFFEKLVVLKGRVLDETGEGIPGVSLSVKGTGYNTLSDPDGRFQLELPEQDKEYILTCQSFGRITQELTLRSPCDITITLENMETEYLGGISYNRSKRSLWHWLTWPFRGKK